MSQLPEEVINAWKKREAPAVLTTVSKAGSPNTIYVGWCGLIDGSRVLIGDVELSKTLDNLKNGRPEVSVLFFAPDCPAYQLKGTPSYHSEGPVYEACKALGKPEFTLRGAVEITVTEAYKGAEKLM